MIVIESDKECRCCILVFRRSIGCKSRHEAKPETAPEDKVVQVGIFGFEGEAILQRREEARVGEKGLIFRLLGFQD